MIDERDPYIYDNDSERTPPVEPGADDRDLSGNSRNDGYPAENISVEDVSTYDADDNAGIGFDSNASRIDRTGGGTGGAAGDAGTGARVRDNRDAGEGGSGYGIDVT